MGEEDFIGNIICWFLVSIFQFVFAGEHLTRRSVGGAAQPVAEEMEESQQDVERGLRPHQATSQGEVGNVGSQTKFLSVSVTEW